MRPILTIALLLITSFCAAQNGYTVRGHIDTLHNGQYLYLYSIDYSKLNPKIYDSSMITHGQFHFEGKLVTPGVLVSLYLKTPRDIFYQFMLENREIELTAKKQLLVKNSPLAEQYKSWKLMSDPFSMDTYFIGRAIDSLKSASAPDTLIAAEEARYAAIKKKQRDAEKQYVRTHPADYISLYWLRYGLTNSLAGQRDTLFQLYSNLSPALKKLDEAKLLLEQLNIMGALKPGLLAPAFTAPNEYGNLIHLADFKGKYVLIDFWASWCAPCVAAIPEMKKVYALYKDKQLEILGVSLDDKQKAWKDAIVRYKLPWMNISELKGWEGEISKQYNIRAIPQNVLIGQDGRILGVDINLVKDLPNLIK